MVAPYNLRSQQDQDTASYANLPGTAGGHFVARNRTLMKDRALHTSVHPGCNPSRWIHELLNNDFTACDIFQRARSAELGAPFEWNDHQHELVVSGNQSYELESFKVLSTLCLRCHFHFTFRMSWDERHADAMCNASMAQWPMREDVFPWHHLVWAGSEPERIVASHKTKYFPLLARENFVCTAPPCTFQVTLDISEPRMGDWWVKLLMDTDTVAEALQKAREHDPVRYEGASDDWARSAPQNLNTYLKNQLEPGKVRTISKLNKRFAVVFGPRSYDIFRMLEFEETSHEDGDGFRPKIPELPEGPKGNTEANTYRAYIEDVRAEVQCLIHRRNPQSTEAPTHVGQQLHRDMGCYPVPDTEWRNVSLSDESFKLLGVHPALPREAVVNAYFRQWDLLPKQRKDIVEALVSVANTFQDEMLSEFAMTQSAVFDSQAEQQAPTEFSSVVDQALQFFGLNPRHTFSAETVIEAFNMKIVRSPAEVKIAREMMESIASASMDGEYQTRILIAMDPKLSLASSKALLNEDGKELTAAQWRVATKKKLEGSKSKDERALYLQALEAIAEHLDDAMLRQATIDLKHEFEHHEDDDGSDRPIDYSLPVGLSNIGNTCYLNSLLQYLFTVKAVRDIVLNYNDYKLALSDEAISERKIGGNKMHMDRGEAVVAHAFVHELGALFRSLQASPQRATKPTQRLANSVLLSTHSLLQVKDTPEDSGTPKPPALPARPSPAPPETSHTDVAMTDVTSTQALDAENASCSSSQTLVDLSDPNGKAKVDADAKGEVIQKTEVEVDQIESKGGLAAADDKLAGETTETVEKVTDHDTAMDDIEEPQTIDEKVLTALKSQTRSSGTAQQDVEEVIGSIINRLQSAIEPSTVDEETGIQVEKIMETFFVTTVNYTKKFDEKNYQNEVSFDRSITAYPAPDGPCSLYEALGRNFDQQVLEDSRLSRYTAIKELPPVLHVLIQRSQSNGQKNDNAVSIEDTLYLDHYMDAPHDSSVFKKRTEAWTRSRRLADLEELLKRIKSSPSSGPLLVKSSTTEQEGPMAEAASGDGALNAIEDWSFDGPVEDDFLLVSKPSSPPASTPSAEADAEPDALTEEVSATEEAIRERLTSEIKMHEDMLAAHFETSKEIPYRLQAVICHSGRLSSGHYWVWIHDFEENVWRKYNDADVQENRDTQKVLQGLSTSGEPYYLCYVRDGDKDNYVNVPKREPVELTPQSGHTNSPVLKVDSDGDTFVPDLELESNDQGSGSSVKLGTASEEIQLD